jgi:lysophospholipid acyltransferase
VAAADRGRRCRHPDTPAHTVNHRSTALNLFSSVVGFLLVYYPFGSHVLHGVVTSLVTYAIMWLMPRKCGTWAWLFCFPYLTML